MKKNNLFVIVNLIFFLIITVHSCKQPEKTKETRVYKCKFISNSPSSPDYLIDSANVWLSSRPADNDFFIFAFEKKVFIHHLKIFYPDKLKNKILKIRLYVDNGILGDFNTDSIFVNKQTGFIAFRILTASSFLPTKFYSDTSCFTVAFEDLNSATAIENIAFYSDSATAINLKIQNYNIPENPHKYTDCTNNIKSLCFDNEKIYVDIGGQKDTLIVGKFAGNDLVVAKVFVFDKNSFTSYADSFAFLQSADTLLLNNNVWHKDFPPDYFVDVRTLDTSIIEDIRYATENNFMDTAVYPCPKCLLRYEVAKQLKKAAIEFRKMGFRIKVFDCYRPHSVQYKLWEIVPNKNYVANPDKGSVHNRGGAVDMTLTDMQGNELDMGTGFDYFGFKAFSIDTLDLPDSVVANRRMMWSVMHKYGFYEIKTEWWHLSYRKKYYPISDVPLPCE